MSYLLHEKPIALDHKKGRYWVFAWSIGEAGGGLDDLVGTYDDLSEAASAAEKEHTSGEDCIQVLDTETMSLAGSMWHGIGPDGEFPA